MNVASPQESSLLLVVPEAERAVREHRAEFDLAARVGVPAHITVAYPFKPVDIMAAKEIERLREMFRTVNPFWVELRTTGWFGDMAARQTLYDASRVRSCHVSSSLTMRRPSSCGPVLHSPLNVQDGSWSKSSLWVGSAPTLLRRQGPLLRRSSCPRATLIGAESAPCPSELQLSADEIGLLVEDSTIGSLEVTAEDKSIIGSAWDDVQVGVEDRLESNLAVGKEQVDALCRHRRVPERLGQPLSDGHHPRSVVRIQVHEVACVLLRNHQEVSRGDRLDVHERRDSIILVDAARWQVTIDNGAEHTVHEQTIPTQACPTRQIKSHAGHCRRHTHLGDGADLA